MIIKFCIYLFTIGINKASDSHVEAWASTTIQSSLLPSLLPYADPSSILMPVTNTRSFLASICRDSQEKALIVIFLLDLSYFFFLELTIVWPIIGPVGHPFDRLGPQFITSPTLVPC